MAYTIQLGVINDTPDPLFLIEQTCWLGGGTAWTTTATTGSESIHTLSMNQSGSSGMLRFRTGKGNQALCRRRRRAQLQALDPKNKVLWAQAANEAAGEVADDAGLQVKVWFYLAEGNRLLATVTVV
ncbi:fungal fruit body lectin [Chaetomidium leptoderma]|uniref:Fungal fruit body lectin n=1 Tax=Chaetomidium leptoderma TaxID=669021 RepID=A0AAN6VBW9_9PEZI|nr:fungal fruit body lectin [Chaetomidium leptoderma]